VGLDPVEQRLIHHTQRAGSRRDALATLDQAHGLLISSVLRARVATFVISFSLLGWNHSARDTFFGDKVNTIIC
jgi:hypothetical protein